MKFNKNYWNNLSENQRRRIKDNVKTIITAIATILAIFFGLSSCTITRTMTTESKSIQRGDTSIVIQTKTIEQINAKKYE